MRRPHASFATRLLVAALAVTLGVLVAVSAFLLLGRERATHDIATGNADNRAAVLDELLAGITERTGRATVTQLAAQPALGSALAGADPSTTVPALFSRTATYTAPGHYLVVLDRQGRVLTSTLPRGLPVPAGSVPSARAALTGPGAGAGLEVATGAGGSLLYVDTTQAVGHGGVRVGAVLDAAPLADQLVAFGPVIGSDYRPAFVPAGATREVVRLSGGTGRQDTAPAALSDALGGSSPTVHATYDAPSEAGGTEPVAGSFVRLTDAAGGLTGYLGVEVPLAVFSADTRSDEVTLALIALFVILATAALVIVFVDRFVRRPVARLERGVARIAGGDYATDIPVGRRDELGRLAEAVNTMRAEIAANIAEIEAQRARLDLAVEQLGGVSRALTTTSNGLPALQRAVVLAATAITGPQTAAVLYSRTAEGYAPAAEVGVEGSPGLQAWGVEEELSAGRAVRAENAPAGWQAGGLLAVPMFYEGEVRGALAVFTAAGVAPTEHDVQALLVLANNAAVAIENTRLFEQERETVQRLRELDRMKSDFLATVQHELRTPLTAIMGMGDLLEMCWTVWGDAEKLEAVTDIQVSSRSLHQIVETIIDFTLLERDRLGLRPAATPVRATVEEALREVASQHKDGLPVRVDLAVGPDDEVWADQERFRQVLRALLDNAVKFSAPGATVHVRSAPAGDGRLRIDVVDEGKGIPEDALGRVFERFYQVDGSATRAHGGMGMGLALARRLAEAHGASVAVESALGRGSMFTVLWPVGPAFAGGELSVPPSVDTAVDGARRPPAMEAGPARDIPSHAWSPPADAVPPPP